MKLGQKVIIPVTGERGTLVDVVDETAFIVTDDGRYFYPHSVAVRECNTTPGQRTYEDDLPEARFLPERIDELEKLVRFNPDTRVRDLTLRLIAAYRDETRTPAIADGSILDELLEIVPATPLHEGMTRDIVADVKRLLARRAIADGVGVDTLALSRFYIDMEPKYTPFALDYFKVCLAELAAFFENNGYEIIRTPPQAATDEGVL